MKLKKIIAVVLSLMMLMGTLTLFAFAKEETALPLSSGLEALQNQFRKGVGPETDGYAVDYRYFSPAGENDTTKYPLVVWLHGMGDGASEGMQVKQHEVAKWTSAEYQSRFNNGGAYIVAPRSLEEKSLFWSDSLIYPLRAAIDDFIAQHKDNIDISRIYVGGYSMGGKMTLKMAVAYPEFFAAAFPICPAWTPDTSATSLIADMPVWMTSSTIDPLVNYFTSVKPTWDNIVATTNMPENCRFSTLKISAYANGVPNISAHHSWYAVNNDMFSDKNGDYPYMTTVDGLGNKVTLTYPEGMISWLSSFTSDYDGTPATDYGNEEAQGGGMNMSVFDLIITFFRSVMDYIKNLF